MDVVLVLKCTKCDQKKDSNLFYNRKDRAKGKQSICVDCQSKRYKMYRLKNTKKLGANFQKWKQKNPKRMKELISIRDKKRDKEFREILLSHKNSPCMDCKIQYPSYAMDFDHRDPSEKLFNVSQINKASSSIKLLEEIAKCDLVCANCHRIRTHNRKVSKT